MYARLHAVITLIGVCLFVAATIIGMRELRLPVATLRVHNVTLAVQVADFPLAWERGLSGHAPLTAGQGMFFIFPNSSPQRFWMYGMTFPLDMVWVRDGAIVGITENIPAPAPTTPVMNLPLYPSPGPVDRVLEINAGLARTLHLEVGDRIELTADK